MGQPPPPKKKENCSAFSSIPSKTGPDKNGRDVIKSDATVRLRTLDKARLLDIQKKTAMYNWSPCSWGLTRERSASFGKLSSKFVILLT